MEKELTFEEVLQDMRILGGSVGVENNILNRFGKTKGGKIISTIVNGDFNIKSNNNNEYALKLRKVLYGHEEEIIFGEKSASYRASHYNIDVINKDGERVGFLNYNIDYSNDNKILVDVNDYEAGGNKEVMDILLNAFEEVSGAVKAEFVSYLCPNNKEDSETIKNHGYVPFDKNAKDFRDQYFVKTEISPTTNYLNLKQKEETRDL